NATGTVRSASQATVSFPVSGLVSGLDVTAGQPVTAGQTLAQLDTTNLANQVSSEQSTLASAQAKLAGDQNSQTATTSTSPSPAVNSTANTSSGGRAGSTGQSSAATRKLGADQAAVVGGQHQVDTDLAATSADL